MVRSFPSFSMWVYLPFFCSLGHTLMDGLRLLLQRKLGMVEVGLIVSLSGLGPVA